MGAAKLATLLLLGSIGIKWTTFHSHAYHYTIKQPSSYRYVPYQDTSKQPVDFFYPALGSSVTSVSVYCDHSNPNLVTYFRSRNGTRVHRSQWLTIMGKRYPLIQANFTASYGARWIQESVNVPVGKEVFHLTASYAPQFRGQRKIMLRMLSTFHSP